MGNETQRKRRVVIDLKGSIWSRHGRRARLEFLPDYIETALKMAGAGETVVVTGPAPAWLYLAIAEAIRSSRLRLQLIYNHPETGDFVVFDRRKE